MNRVRVKFVSRRQLKLSYLQHLSKGGIFLRTDAPLAVGDTLLVAMELPDGQVVEVRGHVIHLQNDPPGMNVRFLDYSPEKARVFEVFLRKNRTVMPEPQKVQTAGTPPGLEELAQSLRRLLWLSADATALDGYTHYQVLGLTPDASGEEIRERCMVLRILLDPAAPPDGAVDPRRILALLYRVAEIEGALGDPHKRAQYDAAKLGILR
jgi:Tfp pilus assembly protein PilZ